MIYLDCNATTPVDAGVRDAMAEALKAFGNPSSAHNEGSRARAIVDGARTRLSKLLGCMPEEIYFTSGGTESNNIAILGTALRHKRGHVITSAIEHPSVSNTVGHLKKAGFDITYAGVDGNCLVSVGEIESAIRDDTVLITIMHSNNETGTLQPIGEIASLARRRGIPFHTDAAQSVGKVEVGAAPVDMMTIAGHKFYGPKGVGALYVKKGKEPLPIMFGAGHERGLRPGTENVPGIAGIGMAAEIAAKELIRRVEEALKLRAMMFGELKKEIGGILLNGHPTFTLPGTLNVVLPGTNSAAIVKALERKLALSAGSACHEGVDKPSSVLKAMGLSDEEAGASLRISIGKDNTEDEIKAATGILLETFYRMARKP